MEMDRSLTGDGPYPVTGRYAVLARVGFVLAIMAIVVAILLPREMIPQFVRSLYLQHFAAFYVLGLLALAAAPRRSLMRLGAELSAFATGMEALHLFAGGAVRPVLDNWVADLGGLAAAFAPIAVARFRRRFERPSPPADEA